MLMNRISVELSSFIIYFFALLLGTNILTAGNVYRLTISGAFISSLKTDFVSLGRFYLGIFIYFTVSKNRSPVLLKDAVLGRLVLRLNSARSAFFFLI